MLFPTTLFAVFFASVYALHWSLPQRSILRKCALLFASIFFYAYWHTGFCAMMLISAAMNHFFAKAIAARPSDRRRSLLITAVTINLFALAFFKYTGFLFTQAVLPLAIPLCKAFGASEALIAFEECAFPFINSIILPIGISFYTFQAIAYVADTASGKFRPAHSFIDFANYLAFFPKLTAGPILRPDALIPQMESLPTRDTPINTGRATTLILGGLFKKTVVANWLAGHLVDPFFQSPEYYGFSDAIIGTIGYSIQIYCDFSAYSDMAIGFALLLGFSFPDNFRAPFIANSFQDFWRRWHISLSTWLRDYLYIPLGGSRCSLWKISRNLILTMLLGGLWHGAGWCYIIWGAIHGVVQAIERPFNQRRKKNATPVSPNFCIRIFQILLTFLVVTFSLIFFRAGAADMEGMSTVKEVFLAFSRFDVPAELFSFKALFFLVLGYSLQALDGDTPRRVWNIFNALHPILRALIAAALLALILGLGPAGIAPFIYFQF